MRVKRLSGLQLEVLGLYRSLLRSAMKKGSTKGQLYQFVRSEFRRKALDIARNDYKTIEHSIRYGQKQKKLMDQPGFTGASYAR